MTTFIPRATKAVAMPSPMPLAPPGDERGLALDLLQRDLSRPARRRGRAAFAGAPALLDREPVGRHRLVGERGERLVEDLPQLVSMVGVGEDVEVVPPDGA